MKKLIITISREFGSGGRELGKRIADILGYSYYDREIITAIAEKHDYDENYVESMLESKFPFTMPITYGRTFSYTDATGQQAIQLMSTQYKLLREFASKGNCVIVGRCADVLLNNEQLLNIFVYADKESKIKRCKERAKPGEVLTDKEIEKKMKEIDKGRADLRKMLADTAWGDKAGYHLMINTSGKEIKSLIPGLAEYVRAYFNEV